MSLEIYWAFCEEKLRIKVYNKVIILQDSNWSGTYIYTLINFETYICIIQVLVWID
jgi:hypothetical protein